jgi:hypothetical protein
MCQQLQANAVIWAAAFWESASGGDEDDKFEAEIAFNNASAYAVAHLAPWHPMLLMAGPNGAMSFAEIVGMTLPAVDAETLKACLEYDADGAKLHISIDAETEWERMLAALQHAPPLAELVLSVAADDEPACRVASTMMVAAGDTRALAVNTPVTLEFTWQGAALVAQATAQAVRSMQHASVAQWAAPPVLQSSQGMGMTILAAGMSVRLRRVQVREMRVSQHMLALGRALAECPHLREVELAGCDVGGNDVQLIAEAQVAHPVCAASAVRRHR